MKLTKKWILKGICNLLIWNSTQKYSFSSARPPMILDNYTEISETNYLNDNLLLDNPAEKLPFLVGPDSTTHQLTHLLFKLACQFKVTLFANFFLPEGYFQQQCTCKHTVITNNFYIHINHFQHQIDDESVTVHK